MKAELLQKLDSQDGHIVDDLFFYFQCAVEDRYYEIHNALIELGIHLGMNIQKSIDENEQNWLKTICIKNPKHEVCIFPTTQVKNKVFCVGLSVFI